MRESFWYFADVEMCLAWIKSCSTLLGGEVVHFYELNWVLLCKLVIIMHFFVESVVQQFDCSVRSLCRDLLTTGSCTRPGETYVQRVYIWNSHLLHIYIYLYIIDIIHLLHILYIHTSFIHCLYIHSFNIYNLHQLAPCIVNVEAWMPFCPQCGGRLLLRMGSSVHWFVGSFFHTEVKELRATDEFYKTSMCSGPLGPLGPLRHAMQWVHEHCAWKR